MLAEGQHYPVHAATGPLAIGALRQPSQDLAVTAMDPVEGPDGQRHGTPDGGTTSDQVVPRDDHHF